MTLTDGDGGGWISGPNGPIKVTDSGNPTSEGMYHFFQLGMGVIKGSYKTVNQFPEKVDELFDLCNTILRLRINGASEEAITLKFKETKGLVDKISEGFESLQDGDDFLEYVDRMKEMFEF